MSQLLLVGIENLKSAATSTYEYVAPSSLNMKDQLIALQQITMFRSWPNVSAMAYNNNSYSYTWIDGTPVSVVMPDGIYTIDDMSAYLQFIMKSNLHYMIDSSGPAPIDVFFMSLVENSVYYRIQINFTVVPAPTATLTIPPGATWAADVGNCPQISLVGLGFNTNSFGSLIGWSSVTNFPTDTTSSLQQLGDLTPTAEPVSQILVQCSLVANQNSMFPNMIFALKAGGLNSGDQIQILPPEFAWVETNGVTNVQNFEIYLTDQNGVRLFVQDPSLTIALYLKPKTTLSVR